MTAVPNMFFNGAPVGTPLRQPYWDSAQVSYGLHAGASVTSTPNGNSAVQVGSVGYVSGGQPWADGSYILDFEAITFDPTATLAGVWIRQKTLFVRRSGSLIVSAQFNEFVLHPESSTTLNTSVPDNSTIDLLITSKLDGAKVCARWVLEHVGQP